MTYKSKNNENEKHTVCRSCPMAENNCKEQSNDDIDNIKAYYPKYLIEKEKNNSKENETPKYTSYPPEQIVVSADQILEHINININTTEIETILDDFIRMTKYIEKEFKLFLDQETKEEKTKEEFTYTYNIHKLLDKVITIIRKNYANNIKKCFSYSNKDLIIDGTNDSYKKVKPTKTHKINRVGKKPELQNEEEYKEMISDLKLEMDRSIEKKEKKINELKPIVEEGMKEIHSENIAHFEEEYLDLKRELDEKAKIKFTEEEVEILTKLTDEEKKEILKRKL